MAANDEYLVAANTNTQVSIVSNASQGEIASRTPKAVATPLPPLNF